MHFDERVVTGEQPHKEPYWYFTTIYECVLCGREKVYRERRYSKRPEDPLQHREWNPDGCPQHFL